MGYVTPETIVIKGFNKKIRGTIFELVPDGEYRLAVPDSDEAWPRNLPRHEQLGYNDPQSSPIRCFFNDSQCGLQQCIGCSGFGCFDWGCDCGPRATEWNGICTECQCPACDGKGQRYYGWTYVIYKTWVPVWGSQDMNHGWNDGAWVMSAYANDGYSIGSNGGTFLQRVIQSKPTDSDTPPTSIGEWEWEYSNYAQ